MASLFQNIQEQALKAKITPRTKDSMQWFNKQLATMAGINRPQVLRDPVLERRSHVVVNRNLVGTVHMFRYNPKEKLTLPYYDQYPVVIIVGKARGGFNALNLHYLPVNLRIRFLDMLYQYTTNDRFDETTRFMSFWNRINKGLMKKFLKPMIKTYLTDNIDGYICKVPASEWEIAAFLPFQRFRKKNQSVVWRDSYKQVMQ